MTSLPALLGALTAILQAHPLCNRVASVETKEFAPDQFLFKVRAELAGEYYVQMRIYYNRAHIDCAYQLFVDAPLLRWDNKEEFSYISTYPHHHHDEHGKVHPSPLVGDPVRDVQIVLQAVSEFVSGRSKV